MEEVPRGDKKAQEITPMTIRRTRRIRTSCISKLMIKSKKWICPCSDQRNLRELNLICHSKLCSKASMWLEKVDLTDSSLLTFPRSCNPSL